MSFWLTSLSVILSRFIHVTANGNISFFLWLILYCINTSCLPYPLICFIFLNFIYLFLAVLGLCCWMQAFSSCDRLELHSSMQASHCGGFSCCSARALGCTGFSSWGSVVVAHRLSCPMACGIFPDQGWDPRPLHWQVDSWPLDHLGSPVHSSGDGHLGCLHVDDLLLINRIQQRWWNVTSENPEECV